MRFVLGPVPRSRVLNPEDQGWTPLREPSSGRFVIWAFLLSIPFLLAVFALLWQLKPFLHAQPLAFAALVSFFALMIPVHETIHALVYPGGLRSKHLVMGLWIRRGLCYVHYDAPLSRNRRLISFSAPFIVLSSALAIAAVLVPPEWRLLAILATLLHASVCTGDLLGFVLFVRQVPKNSLVQNDGWKTYWKSLPEPIAS